jgi:hypothetical protein
MNDEVGHLVRPFFIFHFHPSTLLSAADLEAFASAWFSAKRSVEKLQGVVNPVAKKWHCGADIAVCFLLVKQEGQV